MTNPIQELTEDSGSLNGRLSKLHDRLLKTHPEVDRIACAIYDPESDQLKTFVNSTRQGEAIGAYEFKLSDSRTLSELAKTGEVRVLDDVQKSIQPNNKHSQWLLEQGYRSSFTVPMFDQGEFLGILFFDSSEPAAFTSEVQRDLVLFSSLINMALSSELSAIRSITASVAVAREFANLRDFETGAHIDRMSKNARVIAKALIPKMKLTDEFVEHVYLFAPLHDIGKIGIPDKILLKPGPLDPEERKIMQTHVEKGVEMIKKILGDFNLQQLPDSKVMLNIVGCHHEFMDGSGYPKGLKGDEIPLEARIVTAADILDALVSKRPYKEGWSLDDALSELNKMVAGGKLDADCVAAIEKERAAIEEIIRDYQD